jgi:hypothetical protein
VNGSNQIQHVVLPVLAIMGETRDENYFAASPIWVKTSPGDCVENEPVARQTARAKTVTTMGRNRMRAHKLRLWALCMAMGVSGVANAALQGRDLDGNMATFEAYYDTVLDITWLADANAGAGSVYDDGSSITDGKMTWANANAWAASLSFYNPITNETIGNWRLPTTNDTGLSGCTYTGVNSGLDCGYNVDPNSSEMAQLYFIQLGNLSHLTTTGLVSGAFSGGSNSSSTLDNVGPFTNFQSGIYWSGSESALGLSYAWYFATNIGYQDDGVKTNNYFSLAVRPGDVAAVPEAQTYALMLAGLGLIGWRARRCG